MSPSKTFDYPSNGAGIMDFRRHDTTIVQVGSFKGKWLHPEGLGDLPIGSWSVRMSTIQALQCVLVVYQAVDSKCKPNGKSTHFPLDLPLGSGQENRIFPATASVSVYLQTVTLFLRVYVQGVLQRSVWLVVAL